MKKERIISFLETFGFEYSSESECFLTPYFGSKEPIYLREISFCSDTEQLLKLIIGISYRRGVVLFSRRFFLAFGATDGGHLKPFGVLRNEKSCESIKSQKDLLDAVEDADHRGFSDAQSASIAMIQKIPMFGGSNATSNESNASKLSY